jgi:hypothetical protein
VRILARIHFAGLHFQPGRTREALELRVPVDGWLSSHCRADMRKTSLGWRPIRRRYGASGNAAAGSYSQSASAPKVPREFHGVVQNPADDNPVSASTNGPVCMLEIPFSVCAERLDSICAGL